KLKLNLLAQRLKKNNDIELQVAPKAVEHISDLALDSHSGARRVDLIINSSVVTKLSKAILKHMFSSLPLPKSVSLTTADNGDFELSFSCVSSQM
ncbi:MAG: hypothetical protein LBV23_07170, partial [Deltaproteobacteria bacterium]|nr:hypothetical protein [Deltaproteobacteria bacterium]